MGTFSDEREGEKERERESQVVCGSMPRSVRRGIVERRAKEENLPTKTHYSQLVAPSFFPPSGGDEREGKILVLSPFFLSFFTRLFPWRNIDAMNIRSAHPTLPDVPVFPLGSSVRKSPRFSADASNNTRVTVSPACNNPFPPSLFQPSSSNNSRRNTPSSGKKKPASPYRHLFPPLLQQSLASSSKRRRSYAWNSIREGLSSLTC